MPQASVDMQVPVMPARYAKGMLAIAGAHGLPVDELLALARIEPALLESRRGRISILQFSRLYGAMALALGDEGVGLHARVTPPGAVELLCRAALGTTTLDECLRVLARGLSVVLGDLQASYLPARDGQPARLLLDERLPLQTDRVMAYEFALLTVCGMLAWLFGRRVPVAEVSLPFPPPRHALGLRLLRPQRTQFHAGSAGLAFAPEVLGLRIVRSPDDLQRWIRRAPASLVEALYIRDSLSARIMELLQTSLPQLPALDEVAERLAMSPRTLHRRLSAQGESYQQIKDRWRFRLAAQRLSCSDMPVKQIALELGFSDQATFRRAFAHWAGKPPGAWRRERGIVAL